MSGRLSKFNEWVTKVDFTLAELFIVHDKRDELTGIELKGIVSQLPAKNISLTEGSFGSAAKARNSVLSQCRGTWICFWDSDDSPQFHSVISSLDIDCDIIIGEFETEDRYGSRVRYSHKQEFERNFTNMSFQPGFWRIVFKRKVIENLRFPEITMGEDQDFLAQVNWDRSIAKFVPSLFYRYTIGQDFQTTSKRNSRSSLLESLRFLTTLLANESYNKKLIRNLMCRQLLTILSSKSEGNNFHAMKIFLKSIKKLSDFVTVVFSVSSMLKFLLLRKVS